MSPDTKNYDMIVLGGGPAGILGATTTALCGKSVALVEDHRELGGAGVNTGTVPSKTLRETALALSGMRSRKLYGVDLSLRREATVADFLGHERNVKAGFNQILSQRLQANKVAVYYGAGAFVDPHTIRLAAGPVGDETSAVKSSGGDKPNGEAHAAESLLRGENILIATGSSPLRPSMFPFDHPGVYDSDSVLELDQIPHTMAVVGAGVIGSEYACTFACLGTKVHLIDGRDVLLPFLDGELSRSLAAAMANHGIEFHWKERVVSAEPRQPEGATLTLASGARIEADAVLVAAGRKSNTSRLNLAAAGVQVGERGILPVDDHFRTNVKHIYAAGDVIGFPALASTSMEQARRAARIAVGASAPSEFPSLLPTGIYTIPEAGMVGETEESLIQKGVQYVVGRASYQDGTRGRIIGETEGFLKLLFRRTDMKLLGVHAMGEQATDLVHIGLMAMLCNGTAELFENTCFNIPTLGALYKFATFNAALKER